MKRTMSWSIALAATIAAVPALIANAGEDKLSVQESDQFGAYIADADGRALYMYTADTQGQAGEPATSNCYGTCADAWPPLTADMTATTERTGAEAEGTQQTTPQAAETEPLFQEGSEGKHKVKSELISTTERKDGAMQITYGGWPLYYFEQDSKPGQTTGQGVEDTGGEWYLVAPDGTKIDKH